MNISQLIKGAPELMSGLKDLGLDDQKVGSLGEGIGSQLGGGIDLSSLLNGMNAQSFLEKIDVTALAEQVGVPPALATSAVKLIAPKVAEFTSEGGLGAVAGIAKGLFGQNN